jgi:hypothetical protein
MEVVLSARRSNPVPVNASWDDKVEVQTVDGRNTLPVELFISAVEHFKLRKNDIVISITDSTESPGTKRLVKMVERTQRWLLKLIQSNVPPKLSVVNNSMNVKYTHQFHLSHHLRDLNY